MSGFGNATDLRIGLVAKPNIYRNRLLEPIAGGELVAGTNCCGELVEPKFFQVHASLLQIYVWILIYQHTYMYTHRKESVFIYLYIHVYIDMHCKHVR